MALKLKDQIYFQERENFEGKKEIILTFNCKRCENSNVFNFNNQNCISCLLRSLYLVRNTKFEYISLDLDKPEINFKKYMSFLKYFKHIKKIETYFHNIRRLRKRKCVYEGFQCKIFANDFFDISIVEENYTNPIYIYKLIKNKMNHYKEAIIYPSDCTKCIKSLEKLLNSILDILNQQQIIKDYKKYQKSVKISQNDSNFYENYFYNAQLDKIQVKSFKDRNYKENNHILGTYKVGKNNLYKVFIYRIPNEYERFYDVEFSFESKSDHIFFSKIINDVEKNLELITLDRIISLEDLIKVYKNEARRFISLKYKFAKNKMKKIAFLAALQRLNLQKLFPFLIDDNIEEIFLDSPDDKLYLNHQRFGRCRTNFEFNLKEIERIKTLLRIYSGKTVDYSNPSIKLVINNKYFYCRFAIDTEPINLNRFSLDIRKLNKNIFTIQDLIRNETLSPKIAAFLYFNILRRNNITVTGETNTGKTTLINTLDLLVPKEYRKIYVESITESLNQSKFERHQLKYKVDSLDTLNKMQFSKQNQIRKLLHRTPDIIYLGEILTKEEAEAMFHCLASGLRGFQTIHSNNLDALINRLLYHFEIHISCIRDLDLLILMKKVRDKRKIISVSEINNKVMASKDIYRQLFVYNPELDNWDLLIDLFKTNIIKKIKKTEFLNQKKFDIIMQIYEDIFTFLQNFQKLALKELIALFDKISYYSFLSLKELENFWFSWKLARGLNS